MGQTNNSIRIKQMAKMVQKELAAIFVTESARLFENALISITAVYLDSHFSMAKIYLSFSLNDHKEALWKKVNHHKNTIRRLLGKRIASKMRKVPDLKFCMDDTIIQGIRVTTLIDQLDAVGL